jgi:hypothetical protein
MLLHCYKLNSIGYEWNFDLQMKARVTLNQIQFTELDKEEVDAHQISGGVSL